MTSHVIQPMRTIETMEKKYYMLKVFRKGTLEYLELEFDPKERGTAGISHRHNECVKTQRQ